MFSRSSELGDEVGAADGAHGTAAMGRFSTLAHALHDYAVERLAVQLGFSAGTQGGRGAGRRA